jgi:hypothetical protein
MWVVQEAQLAETLEFYCGGDKIEYRKIDLAIWITKCQYLKFLSETFVRKDVAPYIVLLGVDQTIDCI